MRKFGLSLIAVVLLVLVNFLAYKLPWRWDLTKNSQHTLSENTIDILNSLDREVELTAFYVGIPPKYLSDLLHEFERNSNGKMKTEIIDQIVQIGYAAQFGKVISATEQKVIVRSGGKKGARKDIDFTEEFLSEDLLINAIIQVTRQERTFYFLAGHEEYDILDTEANGFSQLAARLAENHVVSKKLMLAMTGEVPADCDVLVIAGPQTLLSKKEEDLIQKYLERGGDALFLVENVIVTTSDKPLTAAQKKRKPSMNGILNQWGLKIGDDVVIDTANHVGSDAGSPATKNYTEHEAVTQDLDYSFFVRPRSITVIEGRRESLRLASIVSTESKDASWGETDRTLNIKFTPGEDVPGPVAIGVVAMEEKTGDETSDTRIIVFTDADFLSNAFLEQYSHAKLGLNILNWLSEADYQAFMGETQFTEVQRLDLTSKQKRIIILILLLMPLLIAGGGVRTWVRRRV